MQVNGRITDATEQEPRRFRNAIGNRDWFSCIAKVAENVEERFVEKNTNTGDELKKNEELNAVESQPLPQGFEEVQPQPQIQPQSSLSLKEGESSRARTVSGNQEINAETVSRSINQGDQVQSSSNVYSEGEGIKGQEGKINESKEPQTLEQVTQTPPQTQPEAPPTPPTEPPITEPQATEPIKHQISLQVGDQLRSFPIQLDKFEMPTGNDLTYKTLPMKEMYQRGLDVINEKGVEGTIEWLKNDPAFDSSHVASGTILIDKLKNEAINLNLENEANSPEAQALMSKAKEIASTLSERLTKAGQTVKAADIARLLGKDQVVETARKIYEKAHKGKSLPLETEARVKELSDTISRLEKQLEDISNQRNGKKSSQSKEAKAPKQPKAQSRFFSDEQLNKARAFIKDYNETTRGSGGPSTEYLKAAATIGAYHLETGIRNLAEWSAKMIEEFGDSIKPYLDQIKKASYETLMEARREKSLSSMSIKERNAIDEIRDELKRDKELERKQSLSEARQEKKSLKESEKARKELEQQDLRIEDKEKRAKSLAEKKAESKRLSDIRKEKDKAERETKKWYGPIKQESQQAYRRIKDGSTIDEVGDLAKIGADGLLKVGDTINGKVYTESNWSADMTKEFGDSFTKNKREILKEAYETISDTKKKYREQQLVNKVTQGEAGAMTPEQIQELLDLEESLKNQKQRAINELGRVYKNLDRTSMIKRELAASLNLPRAIMASVDLSAAGRQGMIFTVTHPIESAKIFFNEQMKAILKNPEAYRKFENDILWSDADFPLSRKAGVDYSLTSSDRFGTLAQAEEAFMTDIPVRLAENERAFIRNTVGVPFKAIVRSEQAYATFLNMQRLRMFKLYAKELQSKGLTWENAPHEYEAISKFINQATGKGTIPKWMGGKGNAPFLNSIMFAPKWVASRFQLMNQMLNPYTLYKTPSAARLIMMREGIKFAGVLAATGFLLKKSGLADISLNSEDPDFLKVRVGNTHYDISGGFQQEAKFILNLSKAFERYASGDAISKREGKQLSRMTNVPEAFLEDKTAISIVEEYLRRKASPALGVAWDYATGETLEYDPKTNRRLQPTLTKEALKTLIPMVLKDFVEGYNLEGAKGAFKASPSFIGIGTQTYQRNPNTSQILEMKGKARKSLSDLANQP